MKRRDERKGRRREGPMSRADDIHGKRPGQASRAGDQGMRPGQASRAEAKHIIYKLFISQLAFSQKYTQTYLLRLQLQLSK